MDLKNASKYIAGPGRVFTTVLIVLITVSVVQGFVMEAIRMFTYTKRTAAIKSEPQRTDEGKRIERIRQASKHFMADGTLHLVYEPRTERGRIIEPRTEQIYDANDRLIWEGPSNRRPYQYLFWAGQPRYHSEALMLPQIEQLQMLTPVFSRSIEVPVGSINNTEQIWRYRPRAECFEGYNVGGEKIGYIGAAGFSDSASKVKPLGECRLFTAWCPMDSSNPTLLWQTDRRIYQINFEKQHVELVFESNDSDIETISLRGWKDLEPGAVGSVDSKKYRPLLLCTTEDGKHHLILRNPDQRLTFTIPKDWQGWVNNYYRFTATKQGIFLLRNWIEWRASPDYFQDKELYDQWWRDYESQAKKLWVELYEINESGGLELVNRYDWTEPVPSRSVRASPLMADRRFVTDFSPPLYNLILRVLGIEFWARARQFANRGDFFYATVQVPLELRPLNSTENWVLSALMMGFVFWHGLPRRTSRAQFAFWLVFVGVLNLAGLLTYLALNHTAVIKCPACGRQRGLARNDCIHCRAPLPTPKPRDLDLVFKSCC